MLFAFRVPGQQGTAVPLPDQVRIQDVSPETESKKQNDADKKSSSKVKEQGTAVSLPDAVAIPDVSPETESKQLDDAEDKSSLKVGDNAAADDVSPCTPPKRKRPCLRDVRELEKQITRHRRTIEILHQKCQAAMNAPLSCDECDACRDEAIIMFIKFELRLEVAAFR